MRPLAAALVLLLAAAPAQAGEVTVTLAPRDAAERDLLATGLALWSLRRELRNGGSVEQWGRDNAAALTQGGQGNWGLVRQRGRGHEARLDQRGSGNAHAIIQTGRGARARVRQDGGEFGVTLQHGW